jgi:hypothetical protein
MPITISGSTGIAGVDGSASTPAVQGTDTNTGIFFPAADTIAFGEGGSEAMRIDSSGNVGIGTSAPGTKLQVTNSGASDTYIRATNSAATSGFDFGVSSGGDGYLYNRNNAPIIFGTNSAERMRIDTSGNLMVGRTDTAFTVGAGLTVLPTMGVAIGKTSSTSLGACLYMNRTSSVGDGNLVEFAESGTLEGSISVSGTTVSYNGGHLARWSQLLNGARDPALLKGTVLSNLDEMCEWLGPDGQPLPNEQLNRMKISDVEGDPNVAGVFVNWDNDDQSNPYDMNIAMTGDMIIRIAQGVVVQKGDLLMSAGDGTAKPQGDDIRRSKTVAKVTSNHVTCTYPDGSYCVPCVLMAC